MKGFVGGGGSLSEDLWRVNFRATTAKFSRIPQKKLSHKQHTKNTTWTSLHSCEFRPLDPLDFGRQKGEEILTFFQPFHLAVSMHWHPFLVGFITTGVVRFYFWKHKGFIFLKKTRQL